MENINALIRIEELKKQIKRTNEKIIETREEMDRIIEPYRRKIDELTRRKNELVKELNQIQHKLEYAKFVKNVKHAKNKMSLMELILKGAGTFGDYEYYIPSGCEVEPRIFLKLEKEFKNLEEFKEYLEKILGKVEHIDYGLSGFMEKYTEAYINCNEKTPVEVAKKLYLHGFIVGWNGEIYVRCLNKRRTYVRHISKIIVVKKEVSK